MTIDTKRLATDAAYWDIVAPDGATHYIDPTGTVYDDRDGGQFCEQVDSGAYWILPDRQCFWPDSTDVLCIPRPQAPKAEWVDGLPNVGDMVMHPRYGEPCKLRWIGKSGCVIESNFGDEYFAAVEDLEPIRTPEQRQMEGLAALCKRVFMQQTSSTNPYTFDKIADAIIADGWRKAGEE